MQALTQKQGQALCMLARASIGAALGGPKAAPLSDPFAKDRGACFVTVRWSRGAQTDEDAEDAEDAELQGCIGSLEPHRSLEGDVAENAVAAALHDPRGRQLRLSDLDALDVEVSVLSPMTPLHAHTEEEVLAALRPHQDGVVLTNGRRRGTFLPQVWSSFPNPREFLHQLKRKAGLPPVGWDPSYRVLRYTVQKWKHPAPALSAGTPR